MAKCDLHPNIRDRWSPYSFSERPLDPQKLKLVLEAAIYAPSSFNEQPWHYVYAERDDVESFRTFVSFLDEGNQVWASQAGALVVSFARVKSNFTKKENFYALHDCGIALGNILNQATSCGLDVHVMGGFSRQKVRSYFKLGDDVMPVAMMAMGNYGDNSQIPGELAERDMKRKKRKPVEEVIFRNNPANPALNLV
ncbi:MAG: nitroreductase [Bacteroidetes bacterium]|nr:nitroreductase [Bacteroidota bacterium]